MRLFLFDQEPLAFFSLDPARFSTATTPRGAGPGIAIPGWNTALANPHACGLAPMPEHLLGRQAVFSHACLNFREDDFEFRQTGLFCLLPKLFDL